MAHVPGTITLLIENKKGKKNLQNSLSFGLVRFFGLSLTLQSFQGTDRAFVVPLVQFCFLYTKYLLNGMESSRNLTGTPQTVLTWVLHP